MKHKHYDCIVAWAEGKKIQVKEYGSTIWEDLHCTPSWSSHVNYRIKPEPKPDFSTYLTVVRNHTGNQTPLRYHSDNVKFTYDGETGELKSAEVLK